MITLNLSKNKNKTKNISTFLKDMEKKFKHIALGDFQD